MLDLKRLKERRNKARTDLYWLCTEVLDRVLVDEVHRPVCDFFVKKNHKLPLYAQDSVKNRLLLDPRGHFKTTISAADVVQWILNFPDIRILWVSGSQDLAKRVLKEVGQYFVGCEKLLELFPGFKLDEKDLKVNEFTVPCRQNKGTREPTMALSTLNSVKAGSHYDVIKFDDVVNEVNSKEADQLQQTIDDANAIIPLLDPGMYKDVTGTRYHHDDWYGEILDTKKFPWKTFRREACEMPLTPKSKILFTADSAGQPRYNYEVLKPIEESDPNLFSCQYLNRPAKVGVNEFTEELIQSRTIEATKIPFLLKHGLSGDTVRNGAIFIAWDLAFTEKEHSKYSVGAVGFVDRLRRIYIVDGVRGRFSPYDLAMNILSLAAKWHIAGMTPQRIGIEKAGGSQFLEPFLNGEMQRLGYVFPIDWIPTKEVGTENNKEKRIAQTVHPLLKAGDMWINKDLPFYNELKTELIRLGSYKFSDCADAVSRLTRYMQIVDIPPRPDQIQMITAYSDPGISSGMCGGLVG